MVTGVNKLFIKALGKPITTQSMMAELNKVQKLAEDLFKFIYSPRNN